MDAEVQPPAKLQEVKSKQPSSKKPPKKSTFLKGDCRALSESIFARLGKLVGNAMKSEMAAIKPPGTLGMFSIVKDTGHE